MKFIHLTDLHLLEPGNLLWGIDAHTNVRNCLADITKWHSDAEFCVISGDLADRAEPTAYEWLKQELSAFQIPTHLMIGNHDGRAPFRQSFPAIPCDDHGFIQSSFKTPGGTVILLDTFKGGTSAGQYCDKRQDWLRAQLAEAKDDPVWLFMHHPPFDISIPYMDRIKLEEHEEFAEIIAAHPNIRHLFFGHVHRALFVNWRGIACTALPSSCHQIPLDREAIHGKPYSVGPPMYAVVFAAEDQVTVHFEPYNDRGPADM